MGSLLRSILSIFSGKVIGILISLVFTPILVRVISQEQYGLYASVLAGFSIVTLLSKGGLFDATRKIVAEHTDNQPEVSSIISTSLLLSVIYGLLVTSLVLLSLHLRIIPSRYRLYVWVLTGAILFTNVFEIVRGAFYGLQRESIGEALKIVRQLVYTVGALVLAYIGYDVLGVFGAYALSFTLLSIVGAVVLARYSSFGLPRRDGIATYGWEIASFGGYQLVGGLSAMLLYRTDILLVEFFKGGTFTALYQSAITPAEMIWFVPSAIQLAFLQHTASLWTSNKIDEINENLQTGIKYAVLSLTLFGVGLVVLAEPFLTAYFGPEYTDAATTLQVLVFGTFFFGITRVAVPVFQATGWVRHTELITFGALVLNIILNIILIPQYGIIGAGIGTGLSYVTIFVGNVTLWKYSPFDVVSLRWAAKLAMTQGVFAALFLGTVRLVDLSPWISLLVFPSFGLVLFLGINIMAGYVPTQPAQLYLRRVTKYLS
ncbi:oligosaccharide flippase family protein [Halobacterium salinarum]|uniref:oligosaccharide flippase family protein n=1 Tax=Halobacterium salinarum TaxID=2242 RepID=UPI00255593EA|nr:oligosaccharide flippase family protein [Halobacterium salinarum]MDL0138595.1 oligosaccharide flippase family protein [Halobacterium salinarum]